LGQNSAAQNSGKGVAGAVGSVATNIFGGGLGLAPVFTALAHVFGRGNPEPPLTLIPYTPPAPLRLDLADTAQANSSISGFPPILYGQNGLPRLALEDRPRYPQEIAGPHISIHVNALDSRSFMDHSYEIAQAVRQAMLNSHALNDVVTDL